MEINLREVIMSAARFAGSEVDPQEESVIQTFVTQLLCEIEANDADLADEIGKALGCGIWSPSPKLVAA